ncbi:hypothetical protein AB9F35_17230 [Rhizobium leguminosarum]|uniref:hypothetical protein n=1 Tax=Rhizobium leguminosarum TaxID=384 RepID=UPI003F98E1FA
MESDQNARINPRRFRMTVIGFLALTAMIIMCAVFLTLLLIFAGDQFRGTETQLVLDRFPAVIGLPFAAVFALFLVTFLRQTTGPIEAKLLGMEFKGPSGQVVMWLVCFLGIAAAIKLLW